METLLPVLGGFSGQTFFQVSGEAVSTASLWEPLTEDMSLLVPRTMVSLLLSSPFPDASILPTEEKVPRIRTSSSPLAMALVPDKAQVQPELLQIPTEMQSGQSGPSLISEYVLEDFRLEGTERGLLRVLHGTHLKCRGARGSGRMKSFLLE